MPLYLMVQDDSPKRPLAEKLGAACALYFRRFAIPARVALVNPADLPADFAPDVVPVQAVATVQRGVIWVGQEVMHG